MFVFARLIVVISSLYGEHFVLTQDMFDMAACQAQAQEEQQLPHVILARCEEMVAE